MRTTRSMIFAACAAAMLACVSIASHAADPVPERVIYKTAAVGKTEVATPVAYELAPAVTQARAVDWGRWSAQARYELKPMPKAVRDALAAPAAASAVPLRLAPEPLPRHRATSS